MPLSPDASLFIPYEVWGSDEAGWVAVQRDLASNIKFGIVFMSSIKWPTQEEAERHAHDLNYLRERALEAQPVSNYWVSIDIAADEGPAGMVILERVLQSNGVLGWRLLQPAADEDNNAWIKAREMVQSAIESISQEDLPFEDSESLADHLTDRHSVDPDDVGQQSEGWYVHLHRTLHEHPTPDGSLDHTHEWNDEEVTDDASSDEEEGAHEDADS